MIIKLNVGDILTPARPLNNGMVAHWRYAAACSELSEELMPGVELTVVEVGKIPGKLWVLVQLPGEGPPAYLKVAGEEYAHNLQPK